MRFRIGQRVQSLVDSSRMGIVEEIGPIHGGTQYYKVFWGGPAGTEMVCEEDLVPVDPGMKPSEVFCAARFLGYEEFQRIITYHRLRRDEPLRNNIYAFNASRTEHYPYQFKPLVKLLDSVNQRLLICDEVGLGKTIEAGLILVELRARMPMTRVLVVCPAALQVKWQLELRNRFDEEFKVLRRPEFAEFLDDVERNPDRAELNGIVSLQMVRSSQIVDHLNRLGPIFDLVMIDEAHHMRNFGTLSRRAGEALNGNAVAMIMLTATPVQLGTENLHSLLNILDEDGFPDLGTSEHRFGENKPIVAAQTLMGQSPPRVSDAMERLEAASRSIWVRNHPLLGRIREQLAGWNDAHDAKQQRLLQLKVQKDLANLNLLGQIFTRTRKRDVQVDAPVREARAVEVGLTERERWYYESVSEIARDHAETDGRHPVIVQWIVNQVQRRLASSIHATVDFFRANDAFAHDEDSVVDDDNTVLSDEEDTGTTLRAIFARVQDLARHWPSDVHDSKYEKLLEVIQQRFSHTPGCKLLIFAFFKGTLRYLENRFAQAGFGCVRIDGDVDPSERERLVARFRESDDYQIMLSSRVGSEGLDFQFCDTVVNYDLPWNPMEVEQRIGRIDRIGQKASKIHILNMWTEGTIEERILKKLYERLGIFERAIGSLDVVIGDIIRDLERELFSHRLTPEQMARRYKEAELALEQRIVEQEALEGEAARFLGVDQYFDEEIMGVSRNRRYVTSVQLQRFLQDFLHTYAPNAVLRYDQSICRGTICPDTELRTLVQRHGMVGELVRILAAPEDGLAVTFDREVAVAEPSLEFINSLHPLVRLAVENYETVLRERASAQQVSVESRVVPPGTYAFLVYRLKITGARASNFLEVVVLNDDMCEACDREAAEALLGEMVERGQNLRDAGWSVSTDWATRVVGKAQEQFLARVEQLRAEFESDNAVFLEARLAALQVFYENQLQKKRKTLNDLRLKGQPHSVTRMWEGQIAKLESEFGHKVNDLENHRHIGVNWDEVTAGFVQVETPTY